MEDPRFEKLLTEKKAFAANGCYFSKHPDLEALLQPFNDQEKKEIKAIIDHEEDILQKIVPTPDDFIELKFNNDEALKIIEDLFKSLKLKHKVRAKNRMLFIRKSQLDKTAPVFQTKVLQFRSEDWVKCPVSDKQFQDWISDLQRIVREGEELGEKVSQRKRRSNRLKERIAKWAQDSNAAYQHVASRKTKAVEDLSKCIIAVETAVHGEPGLVALSNLIFSFCSLLKSVAQHLDMVFNNKKDLEAIIQKSAQPSEASVGQTKSRDLPKPKNPDPTQLKIIQDAEVFLTQSSLYTDNMTKLAGSIKITSAIVNQRSNRSESLKKIIEGPVCSIGDCFLDSGGHFSELRNVSLEIAKSINDIYTQVQGKHGLKVLASLLDCLATLLLEVVDEIETKQSELHQLLKDAKSFQNKSWEPIFSLTPQIQACCLQTQDKNELFRTEILSLIVY